MNKIKDQKLKCKTIEPRPTRWAGGYLIKRFRVGTAHPTVLNFKLQIRSRSKTSNTQISKENNRATTRVAPTKLLDPRLRGDDRFSVRMGKEKALYPSYGTNVQISKQKHKSIHGQAQLDRATLKRKLLFIIIRAAPEAQAHGRGLENSPIFDTGVNKVSLFQSLDNNS